MARCLLLRFGKLVNCVGGWLGMGLLLSILALCTGCERKKTATGPNGEKATVTHKGEDVEIAFKDRNGAEVHYAGGKSAVALPEGFPADVAIYPKAKVVISRTAEKTMLVMLNTPDSLKKAGEFYKGEMKENGWKIENNINMPGKIILQGKKEKRSLTVAIARESDETIIHLSVDKDNGPATGSHAH